MENALTIFQYYCSYHFNLILFLFFLGIASYLVLLAKKSLPFSVKFWGVCISGMLICLSGISLMTQSFGTQDFSFKYFGTLILLIALTIVVIIASSITMVFTTSAGQIPQETGIKIFKYSFLGSLAIVVAAIVELLIQGLKGELHMSFNITNILLWAYGLASIGIAVYIAIRSISRGLVLYGILAAITFLVCTCCMAMCILVVSLYAVFFMFLLLVISIVSGIKSNSGPSAYLIDEYGRKIYGDFTYANEFTSMNNQKFVKDINGWRSK